MFRNPALWTCCAFNSLLAVVLLAACGGMNPTKDGHVRLFDGGTAPGFQAPDHGAPEDPTGLPAADDAGVPPDAGDPLDPPAQPVPGFDYQASLTEDFAYRDTLPQTTVPESEWFASSNYGPAAATYPEVAVPSGASDPIEWKRDRVIEVAKHFLGVPYAHLHIPAAGGLDCSNFTAWVYNYGFGIRFTSNTQEQAIEAGRRLAPGESLQKGDLLFIWNSSRTSIGHAGIYVDPEHLIDSTSSASPDGVGLRLYEGWYKERFAYARRIIE